MATALAPWHAEGVRLAEVDAALARLRAEAAAEAPSMRTSVMTHIAWVPHGWREQARAALEGMAERHPSRTILLFPEPNAGDRVEHNLNPIGRAYYAFSTLLCTPASLSQDVGLALLCSLEVHI